MRIAIIGAGFAGLATAWHLLQHRRSLHIVVFDPLGIGGGASGIAAGLLNPYSGAHAKLSAHGHEGMKSTCELLECASKTLGSSVANCFGVLRVAVSEEQRQDYQLCAARYGDVKQYTAEQCQRLVPGVLLAEGILITSAITVNCPLYLQGLWRACEREGALFEKGKVSSPSDLKGFDLVVVAAGAATPLFTETAHLPLTPVKGQVLELSWPSHLPPPPLPLNSQAYLVMHPDKATCIVGATYERTFTTHAPEISIAKAEIMPKVCAFLPALEDASIVDCRSGIRMSTPTHLPIISRINKRCWVFSGLGSKGLLYHSLFGRKLAREILETNI